MKRLIYYILIVCFPLFTGTTVSAQCEPDTSCIDIDNNGAFCPDVLPEIITGLPYEAVLTVIPPSEYEFEGNLIDIAYIHIDSVLNFPPGIGYSTNAERFYADSAYCVLISGVPAETGEFTLELHITPYINLPLFGIIKGPQIVDNTSVVLTVQDVTSIEFPTAKQFEVLQNVPNPFSHSTKIGFYTPTNDNISLKIYNILGKLVYEETRMVVPGEHFFRFNGSDLLEGTYLYHVTSGSSHQARKLIKIR